MVRRPEEQAAAGIVELKVGDVYAPALRAAVRQPADAARVMDLMDDAGLELVCSALPTLVLEKPPRVTCLYADGGMVYRIVAAGEGT